MGPIDGVLLGRLDTTTVGPTVGGDGTVVGWKVGADVVIIVGESVGITDGYTDGVALG